MASSQTCLPIYIDISPAEIRNGIFGIAGQVQITAAALEINYRQSGRKRTEREGRFELPLESLRDVALKRGLVSSTVILKPTRLGILDQVPWSCTDAIRLRFKKRFSEQAMALVSRLQTALAELNQDKTASLPFRLPDSDYGLTERTGLLHLEDRVLVFEIASGITGSYTKKRQEIRILPVDLKSIRLRTGLLKDLLHFTLLPGNALATMSGDYQMRLKLKVPKQYREMTKQLVDSVNKWTSAP